jgi:hypothetical protein
MGEFACVHGGVGGGWREGGGQKEEGLVGRPYLLLQLLWTWGGPAIPVSCTPITSQPLHPSPAAAATLPAPHLALRVFQQLQRQLLLPEQHGVGVGHLGTHLCPESLQLRLADDAGVAKPAAVGLDAGGGQVLGLELLVWESRQAQCVQGNSKVFTTVVFTTVLVITVIVKASRQCCKLRLLQVQAAS